MDDIAIDVQSSFTQKGNFIQSLVGQYENKRGAITMSPSKPVRTEPASAFCLLQEENIKGRYIALKSANDRQVVATGFTRNLAHKRAIRKGYNSCIVVANY